MIKDELTFLKALNLVSAVPALYTDRGYTGILQSFPQTLFPADLTPTLPLYLRESSEFSCIAADYFAFYGIILSKKTSNLIILGPAFSTPVTSDELHAYMKDWMLPGSSRESVEYILKNIPQYSYAQFLRLMSLTDYCINDSLRDLDALLYAKTSDSADLSLMDSQQVSALYEIRETQFFHNSYTFEKEMLSYIKNGQPDKLDHLLQHAITPTPGQIGQNGLRQEKNLFITTIALAMRSSISGGLDQEQAYSLADAYIQECEKSTRIDKIEELTYIMLMDFSRRTQRAILPAGVSAEIYEAVQFIRNHTNEHIQVENVAQHIHKSRSALVRKFKQELGFDVSVFITRCKLEEARSLLTFTDKSLSEISNYLCFSSQSYFQNVFKRKYGITPLEYRKNSRKHQTD